MGCKKKLDNGITEKQMSGRLPLALNFSKWPGGKNGGFSATESIYMLTVIGSRLYGVNTIFTNRWSCRGYVYTIYIIQLVETVQACSGYTQ